MQAGGWMGQSKVRSLGGLVTEGNVNTADFLLFW